MIAKTALLWGTLCLATCSRLAPPETASSALTAELRGYRAAGFDCAVAPGSAGIPDGDARGLLLGPLDGFDRAGSIGEIMLALDIVHEWTGDLRAVLHYDADRDGYADLSAPVDFYRVRPLSARAPVLGAYPLPLDGLYFFRDEPGRGDAGGADEPAAARAAGAAPFGAEERPFSVFADAAGGGAFYLAVADTLAGRCGAIRAWAVCRLEAAPRAGGALAGASY